MSPTVRPPGTPRRLSLGPQRLLSQGYIASIKHNMKRVLQPEALALGIKAGTKAVVS